MWGKTTRGRFGELGRVCALCMMMFGEDLFFFWFSRRCVGWKRVGENGGVRASGIDSHSLSKTRTER